MYYKISKYTEVYKQVRELLDKAKEANKKTQALCESIGGNSWAQDSWAIGGGIVAVSFDNKDKIPKDWILSKNCRQDAYRPHASRKSTKEFREKSKSLKKVSVFSISKVLNYDFFPSYIGYSMREDFLYFNVSESKANEYIPPKGAIEITRSEFKTGS